MQARERGTYERFNAKAPKPGKEEAIPQRKAVSEGYAVASDESVTNVNLGGSKTRGVEVPGITTRHGPRAGVRTKDE